GTGYATCAARTASRPRSGSPTDRNRAGAASGLQPVAVPAEVQGPELLAALADQVALREVDLVAVPTQGFSLGTVAPAHHRPAARQRAGRQSSNLRTSTTVGLASADMAVSLRGPAVFSCD